jgi:hypothetical protein
MRARPHYLHSLLTLAPLLLVALACRPVFAIGWGEILVLAIIVTVLLGPLFLRVYRFMATYREHESTHKE